MLIIATEWSKSHTKIREDSLLHAFLNTFCPPNRNNLHFHVMEQSNACTRTHALSLSLFFSHVHPHWFCYVTKMKSYIHQYICTLFFPLKIHHMHPFESINIEFILSDSCIMWTYEIYLPVLLLITFKPFVVFNH